MFMLTTTSTIIRLSIIWFFCECCSVTLNIVSLFFILTKNNFMCSKGIHPSTHRKKKALLAAVDHTHNFFFCHFLSKLFYLSFSPFFFFFISPNFSLRSNVIAHYISINGIRRVQLMKLHESLNRLRNKPINLEYRHMTR